MKYKKCLDGMKWGKKNKFLFYEAGECPTPCILLQHLDKWESSEETFATVQWRMVKQMIHKPLNIFAGSRISRVFIKSCVARWAFLYLHYVERFECHSDGVCVRTKLPACQSWGRLGTFNVPRPLARYKLRWCGKKGGMQSSEIKTKVV